MARLLNETFRRIIDLRPTGGFNTAMALAAASLAAIARLAAIIRFGDFNPKTAVIWEYGEQGLCAIQTGGDLCMRYHGAQAYPSAYVPPLASYLWLGLFRVFGTGSGALLAFDIISLFFGALCAFLVFRLALKLTGRPTTAFASAAIFSLYPTFVFVTTWYETTNIAIALNLVLLLLCLRLASEPPRFATSAAAGALAALCALTRSEMIVIGPFLIVLAVLWHWPRAGAMSRSLAVAGAAMILVLTPWVVRNEILFHRFVPVAQVGGYTLWKGYSKYSEGSGHTLERSPAGMAQANAIRAGVPFGENYEPRLQDAFTKSATADIHSAGVARLAHLAANKTAMIWLFDWTDPLTHHAAYWAPWALVNVCAFFGFVAILRTPRSIEPRCASLIFGMLALMTFVYAMTEVHTRYRMHLEPFLFIFAAIGAQVACSSAIRMVGPISRAGRAPIPP